MHFQEDTQSEILRSAQDDNPGEFFRSLLGALRSERSTILPAVERREIWGIGMSLKWSAAPSSTGRGRSEGKGKSDTCCIPPFYHDQKVAKVDMG